MRFYFQSFCYILLLLRAASAFILDSAWDLKGLLIRGLWASCFLSLPLSVLRTLFLSIFFPCIHGLERYVSPMIIVDLSLPISSTSDQ